VCVKGRKADRKKRGNNKGKGEEIRDEREKEVNGKTVNFWQEC
jgi:hypothetical protein